MPFSLSVQAEEDMVSIAEPDILICGFTVAKPYHDELFALLELIAANPRIARERHIRLSGYIRSKLTSSFTA